jgi:hypothetical protein
MKLKKTVQSEASEAISTNGDIGFGMILFDDKKVANFLLQAGQVGQKTRL